MFPVKNKNVFVGFCFLVFLWIEFKRTSILLGVLLMCLRFCFWGVFCEGKRVFFLVFRVFLCVLSLFWASFFVLRGFVFARIVGHKTY